MSVRHHTRPLRRSLLTILLRAVTAQAATSPARAEAFGAIAGSLLPRLWPREARWSIENVGRACGAVPADVRGPLAKALSCTLGRNLAAMARGLAPVSAGGPGAAALEVGAQGLARLDDACAAGRGAVIVSAHCGPWEALPSSLAAAGYRVGLVVRSLRDPALDAMVRARRSAAGVQLFVRGASSPAEMVDWVRHGGVLGIVLDQAPRGRSTEATWWGHPTRTAVGPAWLAARAGAPLLVATVATLPASPGATPAYALRIDGPVDGRGGTAGRRDVRRTTRCLARVLDAQMRRAPLEWVWFHDREATRG